MLRRLGLGQWAGIAASALVMAWCAGPAAAADTAAAVSVKADPAKLARGKYFARIGGCNDCHTPEYTMRDGQVDEKLWLTGNKVGWRGPWGTTYAPNLRLYIAGLTEEQWVTAAGNLKSRPPMPWFNLREVSDTDLRAFYAYVRSLGTAGEPAPAYVPPDRVPPQPYVQFPSPPPGK